MSYTSHQDRGTKAPKSSWLITLLITLVALVAVGCGDSNEDYVYTGTGPNVGPTGNVTFLFEQATPVAAKIVAPADARFVKFTFFNKDGVAVLKDVDNRAYAASITVANVPVSATSYKIDFFAANGTTAVGTPYTGNVTVEAGKTTIVDPSVGPQPVLQSIDVTPSSFTLALNGTKTQQLKVTANYSGNVIQDVTNGSTFASSAAAIASVNTAGLVTAVAAGDATVTATFGNFTDTAAVKVVAGEDPVPPVGTLVATPASVTLTNATTSVAIATTYDGAAVNATGTLGAFTGNVTATNLVYAAGNVTSTAAVNGSATLTLSYLPEGAEAPVTTTVDVQVERAADEPTPPEPGALTLTLSPADGLKVGTSAGETGLLSNFVLSDDTVVPVANINVLLKDASTGTALTDWSFTKGTDFITIENDAGVGIGSEVTVQLTVTGLTGKTVEPLDVPVEVVADADAAKVVSAEIVSIVGDTFRYPVNSTYPIVARYALANGSEGVIAGAAWNALGTNRGLEIGYAGTGDPSFDAATGTLSSGTVAGGGTIALREIATPANVLDSVALTVITTATNVLSVVPEATTVEEDATLSYSVIVTYADNTTQDITPVRGANFTAGIPAGSVTIASTVDGLYVGSLTADTVGFVSLAAGGGNATGFSLLPAVSIGTGVPVEITAAP